MHQDRVGIFERCGMRNRRLTGDLNPYSMDGVKSYKGCSWVTNTPLPPLCQVHHGSLCKPRPHLQK